MGSERGTGAVRSSAKLIRSWFYNRGRRQTAQWPCPVSCSAAHGLAQLLCPRRPALQSHQHCCSSSPTAPGAASLCFSEPPDFSSSTCPGRAAAMASKRIQKELAGARRQARPRPPWQRLESTGSGDRRPERPGGRSTRLSASTMPVAAAAGSLAADRRVWELAWPAPAPCPGLPAGRPEAEADGADRRSTAPPAALHTAAAAAGCPPAALPAPRGLLPRCLLQTSRKTRPPAARRGQLAMIFSTGALALRVGIRMLPLAIAAL